jgi:hypothetical protein
MWSSFHRVALDKIQRDLSSVRTRVIGVYDEFLIRPSDLSSAPNRKWIKNLSDVATHVEFEPFQEKVDQIEAAGIPNCLDHHFVRLHCVCCRLS